MGSEHVNDDPLVFDRDLGVEQPLDVDEDGVKYSRRSPEA